MENSAKRRSTWIWAHILGVVGFILLWMATSQQASFERKLGMGIIGGFLFWCFGAIFQLRWRLVPLCMVAGALGVPAVGLVWFDLGSDRALLWELIAGAVAGGLLGLGLHWLIVMRGKKIPARQ